MAYYINPKTSGNYPLSYDKEPQGSVVINFGKASIKSEIELDVLKPQINLFVKESPEPVWKDQWFWGGSGIY